ncbi:MAG: carboxypeptidase-like regulatory domain-containing protein, partial [Segetibacter sp.]
MKLLTTITLILFTAVATAQNISGRVTHGASIPLAGVSVSIKDSYDGGTTDSAGKFSFTTTEKGDQVLLLSAIGFKTLEQKIILASVPIELSLSLREAITEVQAVVIFAGSFEAGDRKKGT